MANGGVKSKLEELNVEYTKHNIIDWKQYICSHTNMLPNPTIYGETT